MIPKHKPIRSQKLRDSAKGEECCFQIPGVCSYDTTKTVLCHLPDESHGMGKKSDDFIGAYGDSCCHDVIDRRVKSGLTEMERQWYINRAMIRTWRRWIELGLVKIT